MKKIIFLLMLITASFAVKAQTFVNNTNCDFTVDRYCMSSCNVPTKAYITVIVQAHTTVMAPPIFDCITPNFIAYDFCWSNFDADLCPPPITGCTGYMSPNCGSGQVYWVTPCNSCSNGRSVVFTFDSFTDTWTIELAP